LANRQTRFHPRFICETLVATIRDGFPITFVKHRWIHKTRQYRCRSASQGTPSPDLIRTSLGREKKFGEEIKPADFFSSPSPQPLSQPRAFWWPPVERDEYGATEVTAANEKGAQASLKRFISRRKPGVELGFAPSSTLRLNRSNNIIGFNP